ncbi:hypothetical protein LTR53_014493 [Teratosphaeriaceae sp. CCFEE 6253]|nr:hypothetical protein LTR53_014493 [Teratosphaeriaceae sp. CCFEE 6253]
MSAGSSLTFNRATIVRLAVVFFVLLGLFFSRDLWFPDVPAYTGQKLAPAPEAATTTHAAAPDSQFEEKPAPPPPSPSPSSPAHHDTATAATPSTQQACAEVPGADNVLVLLKTGATELYQKLPTHFVTTFTCVPHFMIFSDLAQDFADYPIHSAIAPVSQHFREHHEDFELYRKLQQYQREGQDMSRLKGDGGWNLDKWKFLPMLFQAFESAGDDIHWFFVMEADTSVSWTNLLQWLKTMDHTEPFYLGAQNVIGDTTFAHGGSGVVVSRKTADLMLARRNKLGKVVYDEQWEELTSTSCCGDEVIARAFLEVGVELTPAWPLIQGETVSSIDWTDNHWCTPAVTWHHVTPIEVDALFQFQSEWVADHDWNTPYLFSDVFDHFIARHVAVNRTSWNNLSQDQKFVSAKLAGADDRDYEKLERYEQAATESAEACAQACERKEVFECVQWMFTPGRCHLGKDIRFGRSDEREEGEEHWTSGWSQERLVMWREKFEGCKKVRWHG